MVINREFWEFLSPYFWITTVRFHHGRAFLSQRQRFNDFQEVTVQLDRNPNCKMLSRYARNTSNTNMFVFAERKLQKTFLCDLVANGGLIVRRCTIQGPKYVHNNSCSHVSGSYHSFICGQTCQVKNEGKKYVFITEYPSLLAHLDLSDPQLNYCTLLATP